MDFKVKENSWRARLASYFMGFPKIAVVVGSTIYLHRISKIDFLQDEAHLAHELCHVAQFKRYGFIKFLLLYSWEHIKHGYQNNRFEIEARAAEKNGLNRN